MKIGYARISRPEQKMELQVDALKREGCEQIFTDTCTGKNTIRPGLDDAISHARAGDTIVVWKLDRMGRCTKHLIDTMKLFNDRGINFKSLQESIDTSTSTGKLIFHMFSALAEFESDLISERTHAGLKAVRARGIKVGNQYAIKNKKTIKQMIEIYDSAKVPVADICALYKISRQTFYNYLKIFKSSEKSLIQQPQ